MAADAADLLAHADWLRGLARRLVGPASADDAVQETYIAAMRTPPDPDLPARPWLARVLRNVTRMGHRSETRRTRREDAVAELAEPATGVDDAVARAETFRMLVDLVLALDEPYRTTLVRHYFDGDTFAAIARRDGVPEATVRGRHKLALERLRTKLDAKSDRSAWVAALAPIAAQHTTPIVVGALVMNKILLALVAAVVVCGVAWKLYPRETPPEVPAALVPPPTRQHHVTQFANADERTKLEHQIEAAGEARRRQVSASLPTPTPRLPPAPLAAAEDLDHEVIRGAMREVIQNITACYEEAMPTLPGNSLSVKAHFEILGDRDVGAIIDAKQIFDDQGNPLPAKLDDCLRSTLQTLQLPPLGDGTVIQVEYPLLFSKAEPSKQINGGSGFEDDGGDDE